MVQSRVYQKKIGEATEERTAYEVSVSKIEVQGQQKPERAESAAEHMDWNGDPPEAEKQE